MKAQKQIFSEIVLNNVQRERKTFSKYACKSHEGIRKDPDREKVSDRKDIRPIFAHDADKIVHSRSYCRYIDKTQVFSLFENDHITRRVLHVQFVSKIGRVIGRCLRLNEDLIEAIALGHDLGHVPYGHEGEIVLNEICKKNSIGCFHHNAQSARLLMDIEQKGEGLNLSLQVLDGILAHNGEMPTNVYKPNKGKTWEQFEEEYSKCFKEKDYYKKITPMTLEGCVVMISDVIAYIGRDIEDAKVLGVIKGSEDIPEEIKKVLGNSNDKIINKLVTNIITNSFGKDCLILTDGVFKALKGLLKFNQEKIYSSPVIDTQRELLDFMFNKLFDYYLDHIKTVRSRLDIRKYFRDQGTKYHENTPLERVVIDYIACMTDDFFNNQYKELFMPKSHGYSL